MAIHRLLKYRGFRPEQIERITKAYAETLLALGIPDGDSLVTQVVAEKITEIAQTGELDPLHLRSRTISDLGVPNVA